MQSASLAFTLAFSTRFYGGMVMKTLMVPIDIAEWSATLALLLAVGLYVLDVTYWPSRRARRAAAGVLGFFLLLAALFAADKKPSLPIGLYMVGMPLLALGLGKFVLVQFGQLSETATLRLLAANFIVTALAAFGSFVQKTWGAIGRWEHDNQARWLAQVGCGEHTLVAAGGNPSSFCTEATFLMWAAELALGGVCLIYGVLLLLVAQSIARISPWAVARLTFALQTSKHKFATLAAGALTERKRAAENKHVLATTKIVTATLLFVMVAVYVATAMAPAGSRLAHTVVSLCFFALVGVALVLLVTFGTETLKSVLDQQPLVRLAASNMRTDNALAQAICVFLFAPLFATYLCLAAANQAMRKCGAAAYTKPLDASDEKLALTKLASAQLQHVRAWPWATVLLTVNYLGVAAWVLLYGSTLTYMGMAVLIAWLKTMHWAAASAIFFVVGIVMFLLPPVPGLAVYLTAGILLVPACEEPFGGEAGGGFWFACGYAAFLAYLMKLAAQVMQQKGIGEVLGQSLYVRSTVGVNSRLIKAIRLILERPGISLAKVSVLCGGPDWPTAVLCGILRADLIQMLLGLSPIFLLTVPTSMAGAFQLRVEEGPGWVTASSMMLMLAGAMQMMFGLLMLYFIEEVKTNQGEQIDAFEDDAEVAAQDARSAAEQVAFERVTAMSAMPLPVKALLLVGTVSMSSSAYLLMFASSECFEDFALTDSLDEVLCLSCPRAAIKPRGFLALALLAVGAVSLVTFKQWAGGQMKRQASGDPCLLERGAAARPPSPSWVPCEDGGFVRVRKSEGGGGGGGKGAAML